MMKLKLKFVNCSSANFPVELSADQQTYGELRKQIALILENKLTLPGTLFEISLNGRDALVADWDTNLKDLGIVSGDIVRILAEGETTFKKLRLDGDEPMAESSSPKQGTSEDISDNPSAPQATGGTSKVCVPGQSGSPADDLSLLEARMINRHLNEPMLCRESTSSQIPASLDQAYRNAGVEDRVDALIVALNVLMSEAGLMQVFDSPSATKVGAWKAHGNVYNMRYSYATCPEKLCQLTCFSMGDVLIVNGLILNAVEIRAPFSTNIEISKYVVADPSAQKDPVSVYGNLAGLSQKFKDAITYQMLRVIQIDAGFVICHELMSLPAEVKMHILTFLDYKSLLTLQSTCKELNALCDEQCLWKRLLLRDYPRSDEAKSCLREQAQEEVSWKELYRKAKKAKEEADRKARLQPQIRFLTFEPRPNAGPNIPNRNPGHDIPHPPGPIFVGGDYDRYPQYFGPGGVRMDIIPGIAPGVAGVPPGFRGPRIDPIDPLGNVPFPGARIPPGADYFGNRRQYDPRDPLAIAPPGVRAPNGADPFGRPHPFDPFRPGGGGFGFI